MSNLQGISRYLQGFNHSLQGFSSILGVPCSVYFYDNKFYVTRVDSGSLYVSTHSASGSALGSVFLEDGVSGLQINIAASSNGMYITKKTAASENPTDGAFRRYDFNGTLLDSINTTVSSLASVEASNSYCYMIPEGTAANARRYDEDITNQTSIDFADQLFFDGDNIWLYFDTLETLKKYSESGTLLETHYLSGLFDYSQQFDIYIISGTLYTSDGSGLIKVIDLSSDTLITTFDISGDYGFKCYNMASDGSYMYCVDRTRNKIDIYEITDFTVVKTIS